MTYEQVRKGMVAAGVATDEAIDRHLGNVESGAITPLMAPLFTVWGRKASELAPS